MAKDDFDKFKGLYILAEAHKMAKDYTFVKNFTLNLVSDFSNLWLDFFNTNKKLIEEVMKKKSDPFKIREVLFLNDICKVIKLVEEDFEIDYVFLANNFVTINEKKLIKKNDERLEKWGKEFKLVKSHGIKINNNHSFNLLTLHKFGDLILNFLFKNELRVEIAKELLTKGLDYKLKDFNATISDDLELKAIFKSPKWNNNYSILI